MASRTVAGRTVLPAVDRSGSRAGSVTAGRQCGALRDPLGAPDTITVWEPGTITVGALDTITVGGPGTMTVWEPGTIVM
jgi:hypothetical protein